MWSYFFRRGVVCDSRVCCLSVGHNGYDMRQLHQHVFLSALLVAFSAMIMLLWWNKGGNISLHHPPRLDLPRPEGTFVSKTMPAMIVDALER